MLFEFSSKVLLFSGACSPEVSKIRRVSLGDNLGVCSFPLSLYLVSLMITLAKETPIEMSSLPLGFALEVHFSWNKMIHRNVKKSSL